tara:strand:- start:2944 stop:3678 length:735 start_codon:yes stop_codon:yes gene_type:complete
MSLIDHFEELRERVLRSLFAILIGSIFSFIFIKDIVKLLESPAKGVHFLQLAPGEFLFISIKVAGYSGLIFSLPFIIFQLLRFIFPGLTEKEKKIITPAVAGSAILFFFGLYFSLSVLIPAALKFLINYGADVVEPIWSIERYLDFVLLLMVSTGLAFQLPIIQFILGSLGLIKSKKMLSSWRSVILSASIAGAVLTPSTDPVTMILLAAAISGLFLIGVGLVAFTEKFKQETPSIAHPPSTAD